MNERSFLTKFEANLIKTIEEYNMFFLYVLLGVQTFLFIYIYIFEKAFFDLKT
jgi:hypothetical protein